MGNTSTAATSGGKDSEESSSTKSLSKASVILVELKELISREIPADQVEERALLLLQQLYICPPSIYQVLDFEALRGIRKHNSMLLVSVVSQVLEMLQGLVLVGKVESSEKRNRTINALRIVTRVMPFLISSKQKSVHDAIWGEAGKTFLASKSGKDLLTAVQKDDKNTEDPIIVEEKTIEETPVSGHDVESKLVSSISGEDLVSSIASSRKGELSKEAGSRSRIGSEELKSSAEVTDPNPEDISKFSMAKRLIHTLMNMLFLPGFTCFKKITPKDLHLKNLWASDDLISEKHDANRIEVLRALLICLSNDLYKKPEGFRHDSNPWVAIACEASRYLTLRKKETSSHVTPEIVLSVLLNTIVNFDPSSRIIIQSKALPYSWTLSTTDFTPGEILVDHCLQVLLVLLEYRTLSPDRRGTIRSEKSLTRGLKVTNHFILGIAKLEDPERLADIISGFSHLLRQSLKGLSVIPVPGAKNFEGYQELTLLLLKFTEINEVRSI